MQREEWPCIFNWTPSLCAPCLPLIFLIVLLSILLLCSQLVKRTAWRWPFLSFTSQKKRGKCIFCLLCAGDGLSKVLSLLSTSKTSFLLVCFQAEQLNVMRSQGCCVHIISGVLIVGREPVDGCHQHL